MNREKVDRIVHATLYEGYVLYPYRPTSVKNQVRWTFGGVHPRPFSEASGGADRWVAQTECLLSGGDDALVEVLVRFLHVTSRTVGELPEPLAELPADTTAELTLPALTTVSALTVDGVIHKPWEEAVEQEVELGSHRLGALLERPHAVAVEVPGARELEALRSVEGTVVGALIRERQPLRGIAELSAERLSDTLSRVTLRVVNTSEMELTGEGDRERAIRLTLVSTHALLGVSGGRWLSLADPPQAATEAAAACRNEGLWPVLVGDAGDDDTILASPIILEDHAQVAPESHGELFDITEIDEILTLRILALTDAEKAEMRSADERTRAMLDRSEALTGEQMMQLHGVFREPGRFDGEQR